MVRLRLRRTGTRNKPCYRIVATDQRSPRDGRFIEVVGFYDPRHQNERVDLSRIDYWLANGAQPSETVSSIIRRAREGKSMTPPEKVRPTEEPVLLTQDDLEPAKEGAEAKAPAAAAPEAAEAPPEAAPEAAEATAEASQEEPTEAAPAEASKEAPAENA